MISKDELLKLFQESLDKEEKGIPLYALHLSNAMFLSNAKAEDQKRVREVLDRLKQDSQQHVEVYKTLIAKVKSEDKDVY